MPGTPDLAKKHNDRVRKQLEHASGLMSKMIHVTVGSQKEPFQVHKDILCSSSPFFRKACNGPWKEKEGWIDLPEDSPRSFETYVQWLYFKALNLEIPETESTDSSVNIYNKNLYSCFVLGDKFLDASFKNSLIDALIQFINVHGYPTNHAKNIYEDLPESSTYRHLYLDFWAWGTDKSCHTRVDWDEAPIEFFKDLAKRQRDIGSRKYKRGGKKPWDSDPCQYHEHPDGTPKCPQSPEQ